MRKEPTYVIGHLQPFKYLRTEYEVVLGYDDIISNMSNLGEHVVERYSVVAVGGTSLVLHNIKSATHDVDFIVECGDVMQFDLDYRKHCGVMIDVSAPGECFGTRLPSDYLSQSTYVGEFGNITVRALSVIDVIITKATRSSASDVADIRECSGVVSVENVLRRMREYSLYSDERVKETIQSVLS